MPHVELEIEVDPEREPGDERLRVSGRLRCGDGPEEAFVGWVGLLALLEQAVSPPARRQADALK